MAYTLVLQKYESMDDRSSASTNVNLLAKNSVRIWIYFSNSRLVSFIFKRMILLKKKVFHLFHNILQFRSFIILFSNRANATRSDNRTKISINKSSIVS